MTRQLLWESLQVAAGSNPDICALRPLSILCKGNSSGDRFACDSEADEHRSCTSPQPSPGLSTTLGIRHGWQSGTLITDCMAAGQCEGVHRAAGGGHLPLGVCDWRHQQADVHDQVCRLDQGLPVTQRPGLPPSVLVVARAASMYEVERQPACLSSVRNQSSSTAAVLRARHCC